MGLRAERKKARKKFKPNDVVTCGNGSVAHRVVSVMPNGVTVDASSAGQSRNYFVPFTGFSYGMKTELRHTDMEPDKVK